MDSCLFCRIAKKDVSAALIYEDDTVFAFLDIHPKAPGHTMVIPKQHAETILDLPDESVPGVFRAVKKVTRMLNESLSPDGFTIGINHGRASGGEVDHLHIHIIPRYTGDGGSSLHSVVNNPPREALEVIARRIQNVKP